MKYSVLLLLIIIGFVSACDSPTRSFNNSNVNDPLSPRFKPGTNTDLQVLADSTGIITISWPEQSEIATKLILEKSLGDALSYSPIAELSPETLVFRDSSLVVRQDTYYRLSSWAGLSERDEVLIESSQAKLDIGGLFNLELEFVEEENNIILSWQTTFPLFTHFVISSDNILNEQDENTVRIEAEGVHHSFTDPLLDIDFEIRSYTVTAVIEHDETEEEISEAGISFDVRDFFRPKGLRVNFLNETDWTVSWRNAPFFATNIEVIRQKNGKPDVIHLLPPETESLIDSLFIRRPNQTNEFRTYLIRFLTDNLASEQVTVSRGLSVPRPVINLTGITEDDPASFKLSWDTPGANLVQEYIIEKSSPPNSQNFVEVGRVSWDVSEFTDTTADPDQPQTYRVRSLTSFPSDAATFVYSNNYEIEYAFPSQMFDVTSMESSSDGRFLVYVSFIGNSAYSNSIRIHDLNARQEFASINIPGHRISDFKLSPDEQYIYFNVGTEGAIYRADFPSGNNVEKIIDDANNGAARALRIDVSRDGSFIVAGGGAAFVKRWNLDTFELDFLYQYQGSNSTSFPSKNISISPDGSLIAYGGSPPFILDAQSGELLEVITGATTANMADYLFSEDGNYFAYVDILSTSLGMVHSTQDWQRTEIIRSAVRIDFHPEDPILLIAGNYRTYTYNVETSQIVDVISNETGGGFRPSYTSPPHYIDENRVALLRFTDKMIYIWKKAPSQGWNFFNVQIYQ